MQKKLFSILCVLGMSLISMPVSSGNSRKSEATKVFAPILFNAPDMDGTFEKIWVEHDVKVDGKKGMRIHTSFVVRNNLNVECTLVAHFYHRGGTQDGTQLDGADLQGDYSTSDGHVVTYVKFKPRFASTRYSDKSLFIPYEEFHFKGPGFHPLKFIVFLERHDRGDQILAKSEEYNFKYTKNTP